MGPSFRARTQSPKKTMDREGKEGKMKTAHKCFSCKT